MSISDGDQDRRAGRAGGRRGSAREVLLFPVRGHNRDAQLLQALWEEAYATSPDQPVS